MDVAIFAIEAADKSAEPANKKYRDTSAHYENANPSKRLNSEPRTVEANEPRSKAHRPESTPTTQNFGLSRGMKDRFSFIKYNRYVPEVASHT